MASRERSAPPTRPPPGRGAAGLEEKVLLPGADFRVLRFRREVFLRFYEFHLENRSHPGCVYYAMPWLAKKHKLDQEQKLWLAFINGNTQNIVTSWLIFRQFPMPKTRGLQTWFDGNWTKLEWDTDRRYQKVEFPKAVAVYCDLVGTSQQKYFRKFEGKDEKGTFNNLWLALRRDFWRFGRLSSFSYAEYLRIMGVPAECDSLFLEDMSGSKSHRSGLAKVLGRDDLDWYKETSFKGDYTAAELAWLEKEGELLLQEARTRTRKNKNIDPREVTYSTLESALCTYKSWHRKDRRYPNVYNDMFCERIQRAQERWPGDQGVLQFWGCRQDCVPKHLRLESNPMDPGLVPEKQNYYRNTGHVIMMSKRWSEFNNPFDRKIWS